MITLTVGATGDYLTFGALLTYLRSIDPLGDDYTIRVQDGTYNEEVDWDIDHGGYSVTINAINPGLAIIDGQATRNNCLHVTGGGLTVNGVRFEDAVAEDVLNEATSASVYSGCSCYRGTIGIADYANAYDFTAVGCYFEDQTVKCIATYSSPGRKSILGCTAYWTNGSGTCDFIFEIDGSTYGVVEGCRASTYNATQGPAHGIFGADFTVRRTRLINMRGSYFRRGWGSTFRLENCLVKKTTGASYDGVYPTAGSSWTIYRCLFMGAGGSFTGVDVTGGSTITIKNTGFHGLTASNAFEVAAGCTVNSTNNGFWNCAGQKGGAGTYNSAGAITTDPGLLAVSSDGVLPPETSTWCNTGNADGLPVVQANPDLGCEEIMPAALMEG